MDKKMKIRKNREFNRVYNKGRNYWNRNLIIYVYKNGSDNSRFGYTITKKIGNAVMRNKIRRRMQEITRLNYNRIKPGYDIVFIPKKNIVDLSYDKLEDSMIHILTLAKLVD